MRVAVAGALGRTGSAVCAGLAALPDFEIAGGLARHGAGSSLQDLLGLAQPAGRVYDDPAVLYDTEKPDVVVDFTVCPVSIEVARLAVERGMSPVIGATGWPSDAIDELRQQCERSGVGAVMAPNFSLGAVLMVRFATEAARLFERAEIVELHDERKLDAPSGTSKLTATRIEEQTGNSVPIHSVRLPGLVAHQEVIFGGEGEALTIRHDSFSRSSFTLGVALAVRKVRELRSLVIGIDAFVAEELG